MEALLGKITQHAMNYAIRSGIGITASYAISQTSRLLKTVDDSADRQELQNLQERLNSKIQIISPAIDMIELISARGNTTLESAVALTKDLRWNIQCLSIRIAKAASTEEISRKGRHGRAKTNTAHEVEIRQIVQDVRKLLARIEDAVPLINLAITTSGARLSTVLPASVSPSRLLQASTFLTAGDSQFQMTPDVPVQIGPAFTLTLYMLFAGHSYRAQDSDGIRDSTWKEVIHKARVKLVRIPLSSNQGISEASLPNSMKGGTYRARSLEDEEHLMAGLGSPNEFSYRLEIIEDLDDDRVHSFNDEEPQPGPYGGVALAGIREFLPIHQVSKIFYADTGKILNIGTQSETNSPVILLKRDVNAQPPRKMMQEDERYEEVYSEPEDLAAHETEDDPESQDDIDQQIRQESSVHLQESPTKGEPLEQLDAWRLPADLDPEWLAFEVYTEVDELSSDDEQDPHDDSAYASHRPSSSGQEPQENNLAEDLAHLNLDPRSSPALPSVSRQMTSSVYSSAVSPPNQSSFGPIRSSLSLLEMLIRLTALQQFQQNSHLAIPDELLTFFLEESSTTGAGGDSDERRRTRHEARMKVGFDPYDESPVKRRGEDYQYQDQHVHQPGSPGATSFDYGRDSPRWSRERSNTPYGSPEPWLYRSVEASAQSSPGIRESSPASPISPYRPVSRKAPVLSNRERLAKAPLRGSPLGRGGSLETDSSLGTSPRSPTLVGKEESARKS